MARALVGISNAGAVSELPEHVQTLLARHIPAGVRGVVAQEFSVSVLHTTGPAK